MTSNTTRTATDGEQRGVALLASLQRQLGRLDANQGNGTGPALSRRELDAARRELNRRGRA